MVTDFGIEDLTISFSFSIEEVIPNPINEFLVLG